MWWHVAYRQQGAAVLVSAHTVYSSMALAWLQVLDGLWSSCDGAQRPAVWGRFSQSVTSMYAHVHACLLALGGPRASPLWLRPARAARSAVIDANWLKRWAPTSSLRGPCMCCGGADVLGVNRLSFGHNSVVRTHAYAGRISLGRAKPPPLLWVPLMCQSIGTWYHAVSETRCRRLPCRAAASVLCARCRACCASGRSSRC